MNHDNDDLQLQIIKQSEALQLQHDAFKIERDCWNIEKDRLYKRISSLEILLNYPKCHRYISSHIFYF